uniref:MIF4G domain-containing protein n=1 Tax=Trichuris muris TaxID=70415 RepID=A0A5S6QAM8_TRIMR
MMSLPWSSMFTRQPTTSTLDRRQEQCQTVVFGNSSSGQPVYGPPQNGISGYSTQNPVMNIAQTGVVQSLVNTVPATPRLMGYPSWGPEYIPQPHMYGSMTAAPPQFTSYPPSFLLPQNCNPPSYGPIYYTPTSYQPMQSNAYEVPQQPPPPPPPPKPKASRQVEIKDPITLKLVNLKEETSTVAASKESLERGHAKAEGPVVISEPQQQHPAQAEENLNGAGPVAIDVLSVQVTAEKPEMVTEDPQTMVRSSKEITNPDYIDDAPSAAAFLPTHEEPTIDKGNAQHDGSSLVSADENACPPVQPLANNEATEPRKASDASLVIRARSDGTEKATSARMEPMTEKELLDLVSQERARVPEMWSPMNFKGEKVYSRKFAFLLRHVDTTFKWHLPDECVVNRSLYDELRLQKDELKSELRDDMIQFGHLRGNYRGRSSGGRIGGKKPSVPTRPSLPANVQLQKSENAWKPNWKKPRELSADSLKTQELYKNVRNVLNKLTPKNLTDMTEQFNEHINSADTMDRMTGVVDIFFEKALSEPNYCNLYSQLCKSTYATTDKKKGKEFKTTLLSRCQREFLNMGRAVEERKDKEEELACAATEAEKERLSVELEDLLWNQKRRRNGNISFIGELYKENLLSLGIMLGCIGTLHNSNTEEGMECLCKLLSSIGHYLENGPNRASEEDLGKLDKLFKALPQKAEAFCSSRIKFMILDLIDLRNNGYRPRRPELQPKSTDEVQREMENKQRALELQTEQLKLTSEGFRQRRTGGGGGSGNRWSLFRSGSGQTGRSRSPIGGRLSSSSKGAGGGGGSSGGYMRTSGSSRLDDRSIAPPYNMTKYVQQGIKAGTLRPHGLPSKSRPDANSSAPASSEVLAENRFALLGVADDGSFSAPNYQKSEPSSPEPSRSRKGGNTSKSDGGRMTKIAKPTASARTFGDMNSSLSQPADQGESTMEEIYSILNDEKFKAIVCPLFDNDESDPEAYVKQIDHPERFVLVWFNHVIDGDLSSRRRLGKVLCHLIRREAISQQAVRLGMINMVRYAMDSTLEMDCPNLFSYFGDVIGSLLVSGGVGLVPCVPLLLPIVDIYGGIKGWRIVANVLLTIKSLTSMSETHALWWENGELNEKLKRDLDDSAVKRLFDEFNLGDLLTTSDDVSLLSNNSSSLKERLVKLNNFVRTVEPVDPREVIAFIERNFSDEEISEEDFIGALIESMCSRSVTDADDGQRIFSKERFDKLVPVLKEYIGNRPEAQRFALDKLTNLFVNLYECLQDMLVEMIKSCEELSAVSPESVLELFAACEKDMEMGFVFKDGSMLHLKKSLMMRLDGNDRSLHLASTTATLPKQ